MKEDMNQANFNFNPPPRPEELFKPDSQNYKIYKGLFDGGLTNVEIQKMFVLSHTRRISDIREKLKPFLLDVKEERITQGTRFYKLTGITNPCPLAEQNRRLMIVPIKTVAKAPRGRRG